MPTKTKKTTSKRPRRFWVESEEEYLRKWYGRRPMDQMCQDINRSARAIFAQAHKMGLVSQRVTRADVRAAVLRLHPLGYSDNEIAKELKTKTGLAIDRHGVSSMRRKLGLPSNQHSSRQRAKASARTRKQLDSLGLDKLADLRAEKWRQAKVNLGWPEELSIRAAQGLELFWRYKTLTRLQLCQLMGVDPKKRTAPHSSRPGGTVLAELAAGGYITRLQRAVKVSVDYKSSKETKPSRPRTTDRSNTCKYIDLYFINPGVTPNVSRKIPTN